MEQFDVVVVGGGPGGLAAAEACANRGVSTVVVEQNSEIGSPTRTSGGSFIHELQSLGIPEHLCHPLKRGRFLSPHNSARFSFEEPMICVIDVRGVFQFLAQRAAESGAQLRVDTQALEPILGEEAVTGVKVRSFRRSEEILNGRIVIDATGYRASISKKVGLHPGFVRFGVGAEFDMYAPGYDQDEAVLIVGSQVAPSGYAWAFPWGNQRVRVGVGIIHADSRANPQDYLETLISHSNLFGLHLDDAQPIEYHYGLIPSDGLCDVFVGNGIMAIGDAAAQAPALVGEGIRWAIKAGRLAGEVAAEAIRRGDCSREFLRKYQEHWKSQYGLNLRIAHEINKKIAAWDDSQWDKGVDMLKLLAPTEFAEALQSHFIGGWLVRAMLKNPSLMKKGVEEFLEFLR
jgi:digeranylgeranylglycerophospholipid reductase